MKTIFLSLLFASTISFGLDSDAILKIASEPHSRENLIGELLLYPDAREYKITTRSGESLADLAAGPEVVGTEKTVRGQFIVSQLKVPGLDNPIIMVVTFDGDTDTFKKWVLLPDGTVASSTGVADFNKRTIAWISNQSHGEPPTTVLSIETHSDEKSTWKETFLQNGTVISISRGEAVKVK